MKLVSVFGLFLNALFYLFVLIGTLAVLCAIVYWPWGTLIIGFCVLASIAALAWEVKHAQKS